MDRSQVHKGLSILTGRICILESLLLKHNKRIARVEAS